MYKKRFGNAVVQDLDTLEAQTGVYQPELQYMNNYQSKAPRMSCFADITESKNSENSLFSFDSDEEEEECVYHHCDAA